MKATRIKLAAVGLVFAAAAAGEMYMARTAGAAMEPGGYLYTLNNDGQENGVVVLARGANGALTQIPGSPVVTGGKGLVVPEGGDFDAQGSVRIHGRFLLAINPGSNSVAVFVIGEGGKLTPAPGSPFPSGGVTPLSVSAHGDIVYVANQSHAYAMSSQAPNVTGFRMSADGRLSPIPGSTIQFPAGQGPAQVEWSPKGGVLAVTAGFQTDGRIHTFAVQPDGTLKQGPGSPFVTREISGTVGFSWSAEGSRLLERMRVGIGDRDHRGRQHRGRVRGTGGGEQRRQSHAGHRCDRAGGSPSNPGSCTRGVTSGCEHNPSFPGGPHQELLAGRVKAMTASPTVDFEENRSL